MEVDWLKKEIEIALDEKLREKLLLLPDFAVDFLYFISLDTEVRTRIEYAKDITLFLEFLLISQKCLKDNVNKIEPDDLDALKNRDFIDFFDYLTNYTRTYTTTTGKTVKQKFSNSAQGKSRKLATLRRLFHYLFVNDHITKDVTQAIEIKVPSKVKISNRLSPDEMNRLFSTIMDDLKIENERQAKFHQKVKFRDYIMVLLLAYTGIRVSELVQLDIDDIHLKRKRLIVLRKGGDEQEITMPERIIDDIQDYVTERKKNTDVEKDSQNALFLSLHKKRIDPKTVRVMLEKYRQRSGIEIKITPHVFRRTFGTNHYNTYKDMYLTAQVLGHDSAETTRKFYADPSEERVSRSMETFDYGESNKPSLSSSKLEKLAKKLGVSVEELLQELD